MTFCHSYSYLIWIHKNDASAGEFKINNGSSLVPQWWRICLPMQKMQSSIPGSGRSPGEGNGNPFQYSYLGNPKDRGVWRATVHGITKSWTRLMQPNNHARQNKNFYEIPIKVFRRDHLKSWMNSSSYIVIYTSAILRRMQFSHITIV